MEKEYQEMFDCALRVRENAYVPYSNFKVGACVKMKDGTLIGGCNVENSSYGVTICAERNAMFKAISMGYKATDFDKLLVLGDTDGLCWPCGACRQVMSEFYNKDDIIIVANVKGDYKAFKFEELLPNSFDKGELI